MPAPQAPVNCPPGLEYLTQIDQVLIHQQVELLEGTNSVLCLLQAVHSEIFGLVKLSLRNAEANKTQNMHGLSVHVIFCFLPAFTSFETNNKYEIKNSMGQRIYFAAEGTQTKLSFYLSISRHRACVFAIQACARTSKIGHVLSASSLSTKAFFEQKATPGDCLFSCRYMLLHAKLLWQRASV